MEKEIEELIRLFRKFQNQIYSSGIKGPDISLFQNINMMIGTYDMIKYQLPPEKLKEIHTSIKEKIRKLINELKHELGKEITNHKNLNTSINNINEMLRKPNISKEEIDKLLDEKLNQRYKNKGNE